MRSFNFISRMECNGVIILDGLSPDGDYQNGINILDELRDLEDAPTKHFHRIALEDEKTLWATLQEIENQSLRNNLRPILHFEAHGTQTGFEIRRSSSPIFVTWDSLTPALRRINHATAYSLGVFVAACEGVAALQDITLRDATPFQYFVAPTEVVSADVLRQTAIEFYRQLFITGNITDAFKSAAHKKPIMLFLAEAFFASVYGKNLKGNSIGKAKKKRIDELVSMAAEILGEEANIQRIRNEARGFANPNAEIFYRVQERFLPGGVGFEFEQLVEFVRGSSALPMPYAGDDK